MKKNNNKYRTYLKIGDEVKIITGKNKGLLGKIIFIDKKKSLIQLDSLPECTRYYTKAEKMRLSQQNSAFATSALTKKTLPHFIHISNIMLWDSNVKQTSRIGYLQAENKKIRYFKKSQAII